jgi:hypothetical protein
MSRGSATQIFDFMFNPGSRGVWCCPCRAFGLHRFSILCSTLIQCVLPMFMPCGQTTQFFDFMLTLFQLCSNIVYVAWLHYTDFRFDVQHWIIRLGCCTCRAVGLHRFSILFPTSIQCVLLLFLLCGQTTQVFDFSLTLFHMCPNIVYVAWFDYTDFRFYFKH